MQHHDSNNTPQVSASADPDPLHRALHVTLFHAHQFRELGSTKARTAVLADLNGLKREEFNFDDLAPKEAVDLAHAYVTVGRNTPPELKSRLSAPDLRSSEDNGVKVDDIFFLALATGCMERFLITSDHARMCLWRSDASNGNPSTRDVENIWAACKALTSPDAYAVGGVWRQSFEGLSSTRHFDSYRETWARVFTFIENTERRFSPYEVALLIDAMASQAAFKLEAVNRLKQDVDDRIPVCAAHLIVKIGVGLGHLNALYDDSFTKRLADRSAEIALHFHLNDAISLSWAFAVALEKKAKSVCASLARHFGTQEITNRELQRLALRSTVLSGNGIPDAWKDIEEDIKRHSRPPTVNAFEHEVATTFQALGWQVMAPAHVATYWCDMLAKKDGQVLIVECDGEAFHYRNWRAQDGLLGPDVGKDKLFKMMNVSVIRIPYAAWQRLRGDEYTKFLNQLIPNHGQD